MEPMVSFGWQPHAESWRVFAKLSVSFFYATTSETALYQDSKWVQTVAQLLLNLIQGIRTAEELGALRKVVDIGTVVYQRMTYCLKTLFPNLP